MAKFGTRAVRQVAGAFSSCITILLLGNQPGSTEPAKTADDGRRIHTFSGVPIRLPRFLSNPKAYSLSPNTVVHLQPTQTAGPQQPHLQLSTRREPVEIGSQGSDPSSLHPRCPRLQQPPTELCGTIGQQQQSPPPMVAGGGLTAIRASGSHQSFCQDERALNRQITGSI